jgi:hypothetical protein
VPVGGAHCKDCSKSSKQRNPAKNKNNAGKPKPTAAEAKECNNQPALSSKTASSSSSHTGDLREKLAKKATTPAVPSVQAVEGKTSKSKPSVASAKNGNNQQAGLVLPFLIIKKPT